MENFGEHLVSKTNLPNVPDKYEEVPLSKFRDIKTKEDIKIIEFKQLDEMVELTNNYIKNPDYSLDLKSNSEGFFIKNGENTLDITISHSNIKETLRALFKLLNNENNLAINGKADFRRIYEKNLFGNERDSEVYYNWTKLGPNGLDEDLARKNNIFVEELYKFTQNVKGIPYEDWEINGHIDRLKNLEN